MHHTLVNQFHVCSADGKVTLFQGLLLTYCCVQTEQYAETYSCLQSCHIRTLMCVPRFDSVSHIFVNIIVAACQTVARNRMYKFTVYADWNRWRRMYSCSIKTSSKSCTLYFLDLPAVVHVHFEKR